MFQTDAKVTNVATGAVTTAATSDGQVTTAHRQRFLGLSLAAGSDAATAIVYDSQTAAGRATADVFQGSAWYVDTADNSVEGFNAAGTDTLTLDGSTRGGLGGSMVYCRAVGANIWLIDCSLNGSGTMVTPWS